MTQVMKRRGGKNFRQAAKNRKESNKGRGRRGGIVEGRFERFSFGPKAVWVYIPVQAYTYEVYDRDEREVILMEDYPYFEYGDHFVPAGNTNWPKGNGRGFTCSATAHNNQPCFGCKLRKLHYKKLDDDEAKTGTRSKEWAPVSKASRFSMSLVIMERILQIPKMKKNPKSRKMEVWKTKKGNTIYDYVPEVVSNMDEEDMKGYSSKYGHKAHWSFSPTHLDQLTDDISPKVQNHCGNCAEEMVCTAFVCPGCETVHTLKHAIAGEDLIEARKVARKCPACQYRGDDWVAMLDCPGCGDPVEGQLIGVFDLRIKAKPLGGDAKGSTLELVGVRMHGLPADVEMDDEELEKLCGSPLDLKAIFVPSTIEDQKKLLNKELIAGLDPSMARESEAYGDDKTEDEDMDLPGSLS